ncbi:ZinT/AdcA family metal-binding protein [Treponema denticola]|uniref:ZinT domain-containing protein n=1 Tax=Treponema denticola SP33 TaxID=999437 RepID=M2BQ32_TREDN|nr:ZinT/AdcA family metal-binding protein [Treponema denticola]EMB24129.1 hypothetical protein HMPREF9733_01578 [Treponema denticola SP33]EPF37725.1 hypothetical protein HMPREF9732_00318 [Treponema denticola SP32]
MVNKKMGAKIALILVTLAVIFTACKSMPAVVEVSPDKLVAGQELAAWKGKWVSTYTVMNDASLNAAYKKTAEGMPYYTEGGLQAAVKDMYGSSVTAMKFNGTNKVTLTMQKKDGSKSNVVCEYKYMGTKAVPGYEGSLWYTFEAVNPGKELQAVKNMIIMPPHQHGDGPVHWHVRFGYYGFDWLINGEKSWPTFVPASTKKNDMLKGAESSIETMPKWTDAAPFKSYAEHGRWINSLLVFENSSKEVMDVYAKLIKEFEGKNPKGGDFTRAEIIAELQKSDDSLKDFTHLEFNIKDGKNELIVFKGSKEIFRSNYVRVAPGKAKAYMTMKAEKKDAGMFSLISFVVVHGAPNYHFHLWYGATEEDIAAQRGTPTCYKVDVPADIRASGIERSAKRTLSALTGK